MIGQREKIYAILRAEDRWIGSLDILKIAHSTNDKKINHINIEPIRRCLQELLDEGKVKKIDVLATGVPLWYAHVCVSEI